MTDFFHHFVFKEWQWLYLLIPAFILLILRRGRGADAALTFSSLSVLVSLGVKVRRSAFSFGVPLALLSLIPAILAMARPVWRNEYQSRSASGIDIMIALDVSLSMSIDDLQNEERRPVDRITAAKKVVASFIEKRTDDRMGLLIFSGRPYSISPITLDHQWLLQGLQGVNLETLKEMGTAIGSAIAASSTRLESREAKSKVIILVTDGASNSGKIAPIEAAEYAHTLGIKIYTIALGTTEGRVSKGIQRFPRQEFDIPTLQKIATMTGGQFYRAENNDRLVDTFKTIDALEKSDSKALTIQDDNELFPWFVTVSGIMALVAATLLAMNPPPSP
jgi:Ca-activated chloride channel family protein